MQHCYMIIFAGKHPEAERAALAMKTFVFKYLKQ